MRLNYSYLLNSIVRNVIIGLLSVLAVFAEDRSITFLPAEHVITQQTRRSSRHDLEVKVSVDVPSVTNSSQAESIPVKFTVKNISKAPLGLGHLGDDYSQGVEIFEAEKVAELPGQNRLFPFAGAGGGGAKEIAPGESLSFVVPVPISLFRMKDVRFIAGVSYGVATGENEGFAGEALSEPFSLPPIPALLAPTPRATPKGTPLPPTPSKPVPTVAPAPTSPALAVAESPAPAVERKSVVWLGLVGMLVLV